MPPRTALAVILLVLAVGLVAGCSAPASSPTDAGGLDARAYMLPDLSCAEGLLSGGVSCLPRFARCSGRDEVPAPSGGCMRVGVEQCDVDGHPGLRAPASPTCKRIGVLRCVTAAGGPGLRGPDDDASVCRAVGAPLPCTPGWRVGSSGWCEPTTQPAPSSCARGEMAAVGDNVCRPLGSCGSGTWGELASSAATIFVDAAFGGTERGSVSAPFRTISAALRAAARLPASNAGTAHVVVAAGRYDEALVIDRPLRLEGRCAAQVELVAPAGANGIEVNARDVELRGLTIRADRRGVDVRPRAQVVLERIVVERCGASALRVGRGASAALRASLLDDNFSFGVEVRGGTATVESSEIRNTRPSPGDLQEGFGIAARPSNDGAPASVTLRDSIVAASHGAGIRLVDAELLVERSMVHHTRPRSSSKLPSSERGAGFGVFATSTTKVTRLTLRDSTVFASYGAGIYAPDAVIELERVVVARTHPRAHDQQDGIGIAAHRDAGTSSLTVRDVIVDHSYHLGVHVAGTLDAQRLLVRNTNAQASNNRRGYALLVETLEAFPTISRATLRDSTLQANARGLFSSGSLVLASRLLVEDTREGPQPTRTGGMGVLATAAAKRASDEHELTLDDCLLRRNNGGLIAHGARVRVARSAVVDSFGGNGVASGSSDMVSAELTLVDSMVARAAAGAVDWRGTASIERCVVRDSGGAAARAGDEVIGFGVVIALHPDRQGNCCPEQIKPSLRLRESLISNHQMVGVGAFGATVEIERSVVRAIRASDPRGFAFGVYAFPQAAGARQLAPEVTLRDSVVSGSFGGGVLAAGARATITRCEIVDTRGAAEAVGLQVVRIGALAGELSLNDSVVANTAGVGVLLQASRGTLTRSTVRDTRASADGELGDGVVVDGQWFSVEGKPLDEPRPAWLDVDRAQIERSARVGVVFAGQGGALHRSVLRDGQLPVYVFDRAQPDVGADNVFVDNQDDRVAFGPQLPLPAPITLPPPPPSN